MITLPYNSSWNFVKINMIFQLIGHNVFQLKIMCPGGNPLILLKVTLYHLSGSLFLSYICHSNTLSVLDFPLLGTSTPSQCVPLFKIKFFGLLFSQTHFLLVFYKFLKSIKSYEGGEKCFSL